MSPIDRFLSDRNIPSFRYVDDIYVPVINLAEAANILRDLIPEFRNYDLVLNEVKSSIIPKTYLFSEEPDLEALFAAAVNEIQDQSSTVGFGIGYGMHEDWDTLSDETDGTSEINSELEATKKLFDSVSKFEGHEDAIERFCLPIFGATSSDYAVEHVKNMLSQRPAMCQIYSIYLAHFINQDESIPKFLLGCLSDKNLFDWQRMWIIAALNSLNSASDDYVKVAASLLANGTHHDAVRGAAAVFVGKFGDHPRRLGLFSVYNSVSEYVKLAIYYSSRQWPKVERKNAVSAWGGHGVLHKLMTSGFKQAQ